VALALGGEAIEDVAEARTKVAGAPDVTFAPAWSTRPRYAAAVADRARAALGEESWELLRPDQPEPDDRGAPGLSIRRVRAVVDEIERL